MTHYTASMDARAITFICLFMCACSSGATPNDGGTDASIDNVVSGGGDASPETSANDANDAGPSSYSLVFPAQTLAAGAEQTFCITQRLGNVASIHVGTITSQLDSGDFQLIVYLSSATTEQTTPQSCTPLNGLLSNTDQAIYIARAPNDTLTFPAGVGLTLEANQMLTVELHQFSVQQTSSSAGAHLSFGVMSDSAFQNGAALWLQAQTNFSVINDGSQHMVTGFNPIPAHMGTAKLFAMTGYENVSGIERKAWNAANAGDTSTQIYDSTTSYDQPLNTTFASPLTFASGAGVAYQCTYVNNSGAPKNAGTGRQDETCMFASYYYPGQGFELCIGTTCTP